MAIYQPLDTSRFEIRLLEIQKSGSNGLRAECRLHTVSLLDNPQYTALSYVWGDTSANEEMALEGHPFAITKSLAAALRFVKFHWQKAFWNRSVSSFRLWADAVCIDQSSITERNRQVRLMDRIYKQAELVIASIAYNDLKVELALSMFRSFDYAYTRLCQDLAEFVTIIRERCKDVESLKYWKALIHTGELPFWNRVWILQELVLARSVLLICDSVSAPYDVVASMDFSWVNRAALHVKHLIELNDAGAVDYPAEEISKILLCEQWQSSNPLEANVDGALLSRSPTASGWVSNLLIRRIMIQQRLEQRQVKNTWQRFIHYHALCANATEDRDHVYGVLGLSGLDLRVDYGRNSAAVYADLFNAMLSMQTPARSRPLDFLVIAGLGLSDGPHYHLSWYPHHGHCKVGTPYVRFGSADEGVFTTSITRTSFENLQLVVDGIVVGSVAAVFEIPDYGWGKVEEQALRYWFQAVLDTMKRHKRAEDHSTPPLQALFRALACLHTEFTADQLMSLLVFVGLFAGRANTRGFDWKLVWDQIPDAALKEGSEEEINTATTHLITMFNQLSQQRRLVISESGHVGLAPLGVEVGDNICILSGCSNPVVLRKVEERELYIGLAWVVGITHGEAACLVRDKLVEIRRFQIS